MKKFYAVGISLAALLLFSWIKVSQAGIPITQPYQGSGPYWNSAFFGTTNPASGTAALVTLPAISKVSGSTTYSGKYCLTRIYGQLSYGTTFFLLDGGTTVYMIQGSGLATSTTATAGGQAGAGNIGTFNLQWPELGPFAGTAGSSMTFSVPIPASSTPNNVINYEGFTFYPYSANSGQ